MCHSWIDKSRPGLGVVGSIAIKQKSMCAADAFFVSKCLMMVITYTLLSQKGSQPCSVDSHVIIGLF